MKGTLGHFLSMDCHSRHCSRNRWRSWPASVCQCVPHSVPLMLHHELFVSLSCSLGWTRCVLCVSLFLSNRTENIHCFPTKIWLCTLFGWQQLAKQLAKQLKCRETTQQVEIEFTTVSGRNSAAFTSLTVILWSHSAATARWLNSVSRSGVKELDTFSPSNNFLSKDIMFRVHMFTEYTMGSDSELQ